MSAFHVYVESPVDRSPQGIERLAIAISKKYGLPVPDLIKRMSAGRFRVKANIDAATADAYARALEEVGARVKVEPAHSTQPNLPVAPEPTPSPKPAAVEAPRAKAPTLPGEKPSRGGRYSVSPPPSSSRHALPGAPRTKTPSTGPGNASSGPPREAHERSQLMPPSRVPPSTAPPLRETLPGTGVPGPARALDDDPFGDLELAAPSSSSSARPSSSMLPVAKDRSGSSSLPPPTTTLTGLSTLEHARPPATTPPANAARPATSSLPPATTPPASAARPATSSLPPPTTPSVNAARPASSSLPPRPRRPSSLQPANSSPPANTPRASNPAFQSGLSAAYSQQIPVASDLGALGDDALSLSPLDGDDDAGVAYDAPSPGMPASIGPPPDAAPAVKFASKPALPFDMFAPPDAEEAEQVVNLAPVEAAASRPQHRSAQSPPLGVPTTPAMRKGPISQGTSMGGVAVPEMPRSRLVAGVILAILIGFLPAHLIASMRETSAFQKIDDEIIATQAAADTPEMYATLDSFRDAQLKRKESERRSIALTSMLIWAVVAAGVGYVWFRRIPWDRAPRA